MRWKIFNFFFVLVVFAISAQLHAEKFYPDDPVWEDQDRIPAPKPVQLDHSELYDFAINSFGDPGEGKNQPAKNVNTLGEVPDSAWFTNRIGRHEMSMEDLIRGSNAGSGPDLKQPWIVKKLKTIGMSAGFTARDSAGDIYFVKFDDIRHVQLSTSAEMVCTKFFYAFGYNVPENYIVRITRTQVVADPNAEIRDDNGKKRRLTEKDLDRYFRKAPRLPDGSYQVIASKLIPGEPVGSFKYYGVRSDDANDIIPHEDRRELRGLRVFSSWLQDFDRRFINSLDMYIRDGSYVKHYLLDFGSTLGAGAVPPINRRVGHEYKIEWGPIFKAYATLGLWDREWRHLKYPKSPSIGTIEAEHFKPELWKPGYPNPTFDRMQNTDAFWATRIILRFTDEVIRALVHTGDYVNSADEEYLRDTLIERRNRIIRYYLSQLNPLDEFKVADSSVIFQNLGLDQGLAPNATYNYQWFRFDNQNSKTESLGPEASVNTTRIPMPVDTSPYLMVRIRTINGSQPNWKKATDVYIRTAQSDVVGIDREN